MSPKSPISNGSLRRRFESYGRVDIVVANAGIELVGVPIADVTEAEYDRVFGVDARGAFFTLRSAARHITDNGRIIYVGSSSTAFPRPGYALYSGSKMAPLLFAEVLAKELGARGVTVNLNITPGR
jgi:3-oxoacyl-[acyl-carrier protein] reductase